MTCKTAVGTMCNYLEGSLSPHGVMALRQHLDDCKDCRLVLDAAQRTLEIDFDRAEASAPLRNVTAA
jgi:predicted anti-sigma-YlaC factor YlaD